MQSIMSYFSGSKKEELIRSTQTLQHYVHKYFTITSRLLEILSTHLEENITPVSANECESIGENCARVRDVMRMILEVSERKDKHVHKSIESALYEKITFSGASLKDKAAIIKDLHQKNMGLLGNTCGPLVTVQLAKSDLGNVMPPVEHQEFQPVLTLALGDLTQRSKRITELLCGTECQQKSLNKAIQLVKDAVTVLKPPCDSYDDIVCEVEAYVTIISEHI
ncbi:uncharacterized protein LOC127432469 isoform X1 [Myxocyprinus asiaticus]|uniref:uncharacterized protein LOC127432469 isoform X1 n=1 Tax=Myxocyprinus asiaticus TaxID=70543 RepID=UPI00222354A1|nr:uncharacterized protein LOC127432469 isoform X1 [Myxocyprinus asiaticus]